MQKIVHTQDFILYSQTNAPDITKSKSTENLGLRHSGFSAQNNRTSFQASLDSRRVASFPNFVGFFVKASTTGHRRENQTERHTMTATQHPNSGFKRQTEHPVSPFPPQSGRRREQGSSVIGAHGNGSVWKVSVLYLVLRPYGNLAMLNSGIDLYGGPLTVWKHV